MKHIIDVFEHTVSLMPDKVAVIEPSRSITYQELRDYALNVSTKLSETFKLNQPIVILKEKSIDTLILMLGTAYAGCHYVMIDPSQPDERIEAILKTLECDALITDEIQRSRISALGEHASILDTQRLLHNHPDTIVHRYTAQISTDPLYILFTSGSTGTPKGVVISLGSTIDFIENFVGTFELNDFDRFGNQAPFDFDVSVKDIYSSLYVGGTLILIPKSYFSNPQQLMDWICDNDVTTLTWAVSALCILSTYKALAYRPLNSLRRVMFSGERMPFKHLKYWRKNYPEISFVNLYGPTEITCNCTYFILDKEKTYEDGLPIGHAFRDDRIILLNENNSLITAPHQSGEICVGGRSLALGYYNNYEQTQKVFVQNPTNKHYRDIIYRTGDIGTYNDAMELCINGRKDFQIKHMGHRIELEEIERKIEEHEDIVRSCCIYHSDKYKIYGVYQGEVEVADLIQYLEQKLPVYMIPNTFIRVNQMPLTKNGKIDRTQLKQEVTL